MYSSDRKFAKEAKRHCVRLAIEKGQIGISLNVLQISIMITIKIVTRIIEKTMSLVLVQLMNQTTTPTIQ